jgi:GMP synthase (glutamine-hydrolysing)
MDLARAALVHDVQITKEAPNYQGRRASAMHDKILILDFGSQVTQLIARRVREAHVYSKSIRTTSMRRLHSRLRAEGRDPVGRPELGTETDTLRVPQAVFDSACRCWASATACRRWPSSSAARSMAAPARIRLRRSARARPYEAARRHQDFTTPEGHGMLKVWMSHGDKVTEMPPGFS